MIVYGVLWLSLPPSQHVVLSWSLQPSMGTNNLRVYVVRESNIKDAQNLKIWSYSKLDSIIKINCRLGCPAL